MTSERTAWGARLASQQATEQERRERRSRVGRVKLGPDAFFSNATDYGGNRHPRDWTRELEFTRGTPCGLCDEEIEDGQYVIPHFDRDARRYRPDVWVHTACYYAEKDREAQEREEADG